jgi:hypothetical protein
MTTMSKKKQHKTQPGSTGRTRDALPKAVKLPFPHPDNGPESAGMAEIGRIVMLDNDPPTKPEPVPHYFCASGKNGEGPVRCRRCGMHEEGLLIRDELCSGWQDWEEDLPSPTPAVRAIKRIQIVVLHNDNVNTFHPVPEGEGWKIDPPSRTLQIGKGVGRVHVPLDNVRYYSPQEY